MLLYYSNLKKGGNWAWGICDLHEKRHMLTRCTYRKAHTKERVLKLVPNNIWCLEWAA